MADETETQTQQGGQPEGAPVETDWKSKFEAQQKVNRDLEAKNKDLYTYKDRTGELEAQLAKLQGTEKEFEETKRLQSVKDEALKAANQRVLKAEIRAAAAGRLADPNDAIRFIDFSKFAVGDDGEVDGDAIDNAISELVTSKPYLAAKDGGGATVNITPPSGRRDGEKPAQLTRADLKTMTPAEIIKAQHDGRLESLLHPSN